NNTKIGELRDLTRAVALVPKGSKVPVEVVRSGKPQSLAVTIGAMPREGEQVAAAPVEQEKEPVAKPTETTGLEQLGLRLAPATPENRAKFGLKDDVKGAVVVAVKQDAPAADRGINVGDVIVGVGQERVASVNDVVTKVKRASDSKQKAVLLL